MKRALLLLVLLVSCAQGPAILFEDATFALELVETPKEKEQGLMFRESLPKNQGMLFIFEDEARRMFWMKDTLIPLDMIFLNEGLEVVDVKNDVQPCKKDPCPRYISKPARYVLEINSGLARTHGIEVGKTARLRE